jgi:hypothetical protein
VAKARDYSVHEPQRNPDQSKRGDPPLSPREGKVLRFVVDRSSGQYKAAVTLEQTVNKIQWSDLPHTLLQAKATLGRLEALGLVQRDGAGYQATDSGSSLIAAANAAKWWNS